MSPRSRRARLTATLVLASACLAAFALFKPAPDDGGEPYVFALSVRSDQGAVLASPVVVGESGRKVEVRLVCEADPRLERMSLVLDPIASAGGDLSYRYELSVPGQVSQAQGTVHLTQGREQQIAVRPPGQRGVTLALYAAPLGHKGLARYLEERRRRLGRTAS